MDNIYVLDQEFNLIGLVDEYVSTIWTSSYSDIGDFELYLGATKDNVALLSKNRYLVRESDISSISVRTDTGNAININDGAESNIIGLSLYGKSTQSGTPTPETPIAINSVGDDGAVEVTVCGKNLLQIIPEYSRTYKGVTVTSKIDDNGLWCIEVKGTSTSNYIDFYPFGGGATTKALNLPDGDYILSGIQPNSGLRLVALCRNDKNPKIDIGNGVKFTQGDNDYYYIRLDVQSEGDFDTVIYPMLRPASITDSTYKAYKSNTATITSGLPLCSVGDVRDELIYNADGTGKVIKHTKEVVVDGVNVKGSLMSYNSDYNTTQWNFGINSNLYTSPYSGFGTAICSHAVCEPIVDSSFTHIVPFNDNGTKYVRCWFVGIGATTTEELNVWLQSNPVTFVYVLKNPIEIELTAEEVNALKNIQFYNGVINVYNADNADMSITYYSLKGGKQVPSYKNVMIIKNIQLLTDVETGDFLSVTGRQLKYLLHQRIVWQQTILRGNTEEALRRLVDENGINPINKNRVIPNLVLGELAGLTDTIEKQVTGDYLDRAITDICLSYNYGWDLYICNNQLVFKVYKGCDRSYDQTERPYVVFSDTFENLYNTEYVMNSEEYANTTLIGGEGEGRDRLYSMVGNENTGLDRYETFTDADSISRNEGGDDEISLEEYYLLLDQKGYENLSTLNYTEAFTGEILSNVTFIFGEDFDLGDTVTVINNYGMTRTVRVVGLTESQDEAGNKLLPQFNI